MNKGELSPTPHFVVVYYQVGVVHPSMVLSYYVGYYPTAACDSQGYPGGSFLHAVQNYKYWLMIHKYHAKL